MGEVEANVAGPGRTPVHLWIVGVLSLLWNLMGAWDYAATKLGLEFYLSQFPEEMLAFVDAMPAWATAAWAFGVWGALAGSVGLLLRKKWAFWAFAVSLAGLFFGTIYSYVLSNGSELMGATGAIFNVLIWIVAIFLLVYSKAMAGKSVLT
jgi:hypothetical protein